MRIAFTGGLALKNPGPTGAANVIKKNGFNDTLIMLATEVSTKSSNFDGELRALSIAAEYGVRNISPNNNKVYFFIDCQAVIYTVMNQRKINNTNKNDVHEIW